MTKGQLIEVAEEFYGICLSVDEVADPHKAVVYKGSGYQHCFRLNFNNADYMTSRQSQSSGIEMERKIPPFGWNTLGPVKHSTLLQLFPLAFVFGADLRISATGHQLARMYQPAALMHQPLQSVAKLRRPKISCTWPDVSNTL